MADGGTELLTKHRLITNIFVENANLNAPTKLINATNGTMSNFSIPGMNVIDGNANSTTNMQQPNPRYNDL